MLQLSFLAFDPRPTHYDTNMDSSTTGSMKGQTSPSTSARSQSSCTTCSHTICSTTIHVCNQEFLTYHSDSTCQTSSTKSHFIRDYVMASSEFECKILLFIIIHVSCKFSPSTNPITLRKVQTLVKLVNMNGFVMQLLEHGMVHMLDKFVCHFLPRSLPLLSPLPPSHLQTHRL